MTATVMMERLAEASPLATLVTLACDATAAFIFYDLLRPVSTSLSFERHI